METKQIPGYEGLYSLSEDGKVWRADGTELKPHMSGVERRNYYQVTLYRKNGGGKKEKKTWRVHVLMGLTFMGHKSCRKWVIDHDDNDPLNNNLSNLKILDHVTNCTKDRRNPRRPWKYEDKYKAVEDSDVPF